MKLSQLTIHRIIERKYQRALGKLVLGKMALGKKALGKFSCNPVLNLRMLGQQDIAASLLVSCSQYSLKRIKFGNDLHKKKKIMQQVDSQMREVSKCQQN